MICVRVCVHARTSGCDFVRVCVRDCFCVVCPCLCSCFIYVSFCWGKCSETKRFRARTMSFGYCPGYIWVAQADAVSWVVAQKQKLYRWTGHVARYDDDRWTSTVEGWVPTGGVAQEAVGRGRRRARPCRRWSDAIAEFSACVGVADWRLFARDRARWQSFDQSFVHAIVC